MALIENLEHDGWQEFFCNSFRYALDVLKNDRFQRFGSSVDDLSSWLAAGGVARVREHLNNQMKMRGFPAMRKAAVNDCLEQLVRDNRGALLDLMADGIVPTTKQEQFTACGLSESNFQDILIRIIKGERPFEDWMHAHGHSDEEIANIYSVIDQWLMDNSGIIPSSPPSSSLH
ncbi:MAG: hypothetical protein GY862_26020 [Gammaproteobacteria bacterium]|nr:hypothetical protein [Gammaproteobacteria bacterium]